MVEHPQTIDLIQGWRATVRGGVDDKQRVWSVVCLHPGHASHGDTLGLVDRLWPVFAGGTAQRVVVDMSEVSFLGSSLIGELIRLHKRLAMQDGVLHLSALQPTCYEALCICRLDKILPSYLNEQEAMQIG